MESPGDNFTVPFLIFPSQEYKKLKKEIQTHDLIEEAGIEHINVLLVGECSAGKSSFFNSVESVFAGFVSSTAEAGTDEGSLTKQVDHDIRCVAKFPPQFRTYEIDAGDGAGKPIKFKYCDTMGVESTEGLTPSDFGKIMDGHIEDTAEVNFFDWNLTLILTQLSQSGLMVPGSSGYNPRPTEADRMHCVAFVISADTLSAMDETIEDKFKDVLKEARPRRKTDLVS